MWTTIVCICSVDILSNNRIEVHTVNTAQQICNYDCGLFIKPYAFDLFLNNNPANVVYDQKQLESITTHLLQIFISPHLSKWQATWYSIMRSIVSIKEIIIHWIGRQLDCPSVITFSAASKEDSVLGSIKNTLSSWTEEIARDFIGDFMQIYKLVHGIGQR